MKFIKKENDVNKVRYLNLEELKDYISNKIDYENANIINNANNIINNINTILINIINIGEEIEAIKPDKSKLAVQYINAMNNAKNSIMTVIKSIKVIKSVRNIEELYKYEADIKSILTKIGQVAGSHRRVIYELFPIQGKKLKTELSKLNSYIQELEHILNNYKNKTNTFHNINNNIANIFKYKEELSRLKINNELFEEYERVKLNNDSINEALNKIKNNEYFILFNELSDINGKYNKLVNEFNEEISNVIRAIKKYEYTIGIEKTKKSMLDNLVNNNIKEIDQNVIISLFNDTIKAIREGRIELKNSDKIIKNIENLISKLPGYINIINEYNVKISSIKDSMKPLEIKIKELESNLEYNNMLLANINNKMKEHNDNIQTLKDSISNSIKSINDLLITYEPTIRLDLSNINI